MWTRQRYMTKRGTCLPLGNVVRFLLLGFRESTRLHYLEGREGRRICVSVLCFTTGNPLSGSKDGEGKSGHEVLGAFLIPGKRLPLFRVNSETGVGRRAIHGGSRSIKAKGIQNSGRVCKGKIHGKLS